MEPLPLSAGCGQLTAPLRLRQLPDRCCAVWCHFVRDWRLRLSVRDRWLFGDETCLPNKRDLAASGMRPNRL